MNTILSPILKNVGAYDEFDQGVRSQAKLTICVWDLPWSYERAPAQGPEALSIDCFGPCRVSVTVRSFLMHSRNCGSP